MKEKPKPSKTIEQHYSIDQVAAKLSVHRSTVEAFVCMAGSSDTAK